MRSFAWCVVGAIAALCISCGKDHRDLPTSFIYDPPPTPTNFVVTGGEEMSTITWSYPAPARASIREFRVYEYIESYNMMTLIDTTTDTVFVDSLLIGNLQYCYKVSAVDTSGLEGWRTDKACAFVRSVR
ncbi:MAG: hypothetical protein NTW97_03015 [Candidatus Krumholzibacteria bacterium]|nr:hypothetical protein [Candidatus Krumholzibacteria bacterium]